MGIAKRNNLEEKYKFRSRRNDKLRRINKKFTQILSSYSDYGYNSRDDFISWAKKTSVRECNLRKPCSCHMCGNPRRHFKTRTLAEIVFDDRFKSYIIEEEKDILWNLRKLKTNGINLILIQEVYIQKNL